MEKKSIVDESDRRTKSNFNSNTSNDMSFLNIGLIDSKPKEKGFFQNCCQKLFSFGRKKNNNTFSLD